MAYEFRALHLRLNSDCKKHCCRHALNSAVLPPTIPCPTLHACSVCTACNQGTLLLNDIDGLINHIRDQLDEDNIAMRNEMASMLKASIEVFRPTIVDYVAHQVRAYAKFAKIKEEISQFTNKRCGLWFDHKQKVLPAKFREGQVEYLVKGV